MNSFVENLKELSRLLHWLGKFAAANELIKLAVLMELYGLVTYEDLSSAIKTNEISAQTLDKAANDDLEGCYKTVQDWHKKELAKVELPNNLMKPA